MLSYGRHSSMSDERILGIYTQRVKLSQHENFFCFIFITLLVNYKNRYSLYIFIHYPIHLNNFNKKTSFTMDIPSIFHIGVKIKIHKKCQYLVCPLLAWMTAKQRRLILFMSRLMTRKGVCAHSSCKARSRSLTLLTSFRSRNLRPRWSHRWSIGEGNGK